MIKSFVAYTTEIDSPELAVEQLLEQLDFGGKNALRQNTIGIVSCYAEFIESGVWEHLCANLPFEVLGTTTIANMVPAELGETMLTLMVLTSDEIGFSTALSEPIVEEDALQLRAMYETALAKLPAKPSVMMSFLPLHSNFSTDFYVDCLTEISGGVPNFGTVTVDHNTDYHDSQVLLNGKGYPDRAAVLLIHGEVTPTFYIGNISEERVFDEKGVVTAAEKNRLEEVDGAPVVEYLRSIGLKQNEDGSIVGINSFPVIVDYNDGSAPVARVIFAMTPEGYAVCGGHIPVGATLSIGSFDGEEISATTLRTIEDVLASEKHSIALMYSCVGRYFSQGHDTTAELRQVRERLEGTDVNYMMSYSGGEICPVYNADGQPFTRNHNNTIVICAL